MRSAPTSYLQRLRDELAAIRADMDVLLEASDIRYVNPNRPDSSVIFVSAADWGWAASEPETAAMQMALLARYRAWFDRLRLLFPHPTPAVERKIKDADKFVRRWTTRPDSYDHSIPRTVPEAKARSAKEFAAFDELLDLVARTGSDELRLVPDTNALIRNPDIGSYARAAPAKTFHVHLVPTVLGELDDLKDRGKTQELRDQAQAVVRRLKGLRDKGNLAIGVKLTKTITVRAEAREVDVRSVLDWLDPAVPDDRLLAAALRLQSDHPAGSVVLVTSDLNLQNKADAVGLPYIETPPTPASLRADLAASLAWPSPTGPPVIRLMNRGPATARHIVYSVATPPDSVPPYVRAGPWEVEKLGVGAVDTQVVIGFYGEVVVVTATWTDDDGTRDLSWAIDLPARPAAPAGDLSP